MHKLHVKEMDRYLDFWNLMAYDFGAFHPPYLMYNPANLTVAVQLDLGTASPTTKPICLGLP